MREQGLSEPRQISGGLALGAGLIAGALVAMRPFVPDEPGPSAAAAFALAVAVLLAGTVWIKAVAEGGFVLPPWRVAAPFGSLMLLGLVMTAFAVNTWRAELELMSWIASALGFLSIYALTARHEAEPGRTIPHEREGERRLVLSALVATGAVAAIVGVAASVRGGGVPGFASSPNAFACFVAMMLPLAAGTAAAAGREGRVRAARMAWAVAALSGVALIANGSEGGFVAALAGLAAMGAFLKKRPLAEFARAKLPRTAHGRAFAFAGLLAILALAVVFLLMVSPSMRNRVEFWRAALRMIVDNPMGIGLGNFGDHYWQYRTYAGLDTLDPRSSYLALTTEAGVASLAVAVALAWGFFRLAAGGDEGETNQTRLSAAPDEVEVASENLLGVFGVVGGVTGLFAALLSHSALRAMMFGPVDLASVGGALFLVAMLPAWVLVFAVVGRVKAGGRHMRAGLLGMLVVVAVHASVETVFAHGGVAMTAAAGGALALALAGGRSTEVRLRGLGGLLRSLAFAVAIGFVLWRGLGRQVSLWEKAELAERSLERAIELEMLGDDLAAITEDRMDRPAIRRLLSLPVAGVDTSELARAVGASPDAEVARVAQEVRAKANELALEWLGESWRLLDEYLATEPGDLERGRLLVEVDRLLARRGAAIDEGEFVARTLKTLTELSPASFVPWRELGELHARRGHMTQAAAALEEAARRHPTSPILQLSLGDARALFDPDAALSAYQRAFEVNRKLRHAHPGLFGRLWRTRPRRPESVDLIMALDRMDDSLGVHAEIALRRALAAAEYGGFSKARDIAERALDARPNDPQAALFVAVFAEMAAALDGEPSPEHAWSLAEATQRYAPPELRMRPEAFAGIALRRDLFRAAALGRPTR